MHQDFDALLDGYLTGTLSEAETQRFFEMIGDPEHRARLESVIDHAAEERSLVGLGQEDLQARSLRQLQHRLQMETAAGVPKVRRMNWKYAAAAAVILAIAATVWIALPRGSRTTQPLAQRADIERVQGAVTLSLPDGRALSLDSMAPDPSGTSQASEFERFGRTPADENVQQFYTINTARGRQFRLLLEDGTIAYLNAASTIKFPTSFNGAATRDVEISGEVYFEVAKNALAPFRVKVNDNMQVEVLGTNFNIKAYTDEGKTTTSLLEGAVRIHHGGEQLTMKPGQQVTAIKGGAMQMSPGDVNESVAWKNGRFELYGNVHEIMRQLQRWYDIAEVQYAAGVDSTILVATVSTSKKLSEVLEILEKTGSIHFDIEGNKVTVMPSRQ